MDAKYFVESEDHSVSETSVGGFVTNGSNHWILRQPDQVSKN